MKWRDLTGPEKKRLFQKIDIPTLFPLLARKEEFQKLRNDFTTLGDIFSVSIDCNPTQFDNLICKESGD